MEDTTAGVPYPRSQNVTAAASGEAVSGELSWSSAEAVCLGAFLSLMIVTNIAGNTLTIVAFVRDKRLQIVQNLYVLNLAVTDLIIGGVSVPISTLYTIRNYAWPFSRAVCKVYTILDYWACAESSLTIILISYDRLLMVRDGIAYNQQQTKRRALLRISLSWMFSFLIYSPAIIGYAQWRGYSVLEDTECYVEFAYDATYLLISSSFDFFIPFVLLTVFNSMIYWNLRHRSRKIMDSSSNSSESVTRLKKDKKAAKSLALLITVYAICWSPYVLSTIITSAVGYELSPLTYEALVWLLWLNSSLNPICYAVTNPHFRRQYAKMLCCFRGRKRQHGQTHASHSVTRTSTD